MPDIIAETVHENENCRDYLRNVSENTGDQLKSCKTKAEEATVYKDYFEFSEPVQRCPSHRYLAMMRGEQEGMLRVFIDIDEERALDWLHRKFILPGVKQPIRFRWPSLMVINV